MEIGKIYGSDEDYGGGVKIRIDSMDETKICATVISVDEFWSSPDRIYVLVKEHDGTETRSINFEVGQKLEFGSHGGKIESPEHLPWFSLNIDKGYFLHYR